MLDVTATITLSSYITTNCGIIQNVHKVLIYVFKIPLYSNYLTVATTESVAFNNEMWCDSYVYIYIHIFL